MTFDRKHRLVADAVDWKENTVGPPDESGQQSDILRLATIMMQKAAPEPLDQIAQVRDRAGPSADIEDRAVGER